MFARPPRLGSNYQMPHSLAAKSECGCPYWYLAAAACSHGRAGLFRLFLVDYRDDRQRDIFTDQSVVCDSVQTNRRKRRAASSWSLTGREVML